MTTTANMETDDRRDDMENSTTEVNPWPYIKDHFGYKSQKGKSIIMQCKMCLPKEVK
jgi:hypothetical protein